MTLYHIAAAILLAMAITLLPAAYMWLDGQVVFGRRK